MRKYQFIQGAFQPLTQPAVTAVRAAMPHAWRTVVLVRKTEGPFNFEDITSMWRAVFPVETELGLLVVKQADVKPYGMPEIKWDDGQEERAREDLATSGPFWSRGIPEPVRRVIERSRKARADGSGLFVLSESERPVEGGAGVLPAS